MRLITPLHTADFFPGAPDCAALSPCPGAGEGACFYLPPRAAITDVHARARALLRQGRVMILYIDGLGYSLYIRARLPFIKRTFPCVSARTAFPPLTQPCMASMLTGAWPDAHGIRSRRDHRPRIPSLLGMPGAAWVEADSAPLRLETAPVLTLPGPDGDVDAAVLRAALPLAAGDARLLVVHFHGLDDMEHDVGDDEALLAPKLAQLDEAAHALCDAFAGAVILCADHGVHAEDGHGAHGAFDHRDMFVPLGEAIV